MTARVPGTRIVRMLARLVPSSHRADWLAEWTAELTHSPLSPARNRLRALGALSDALWIRRHHGSLSGLDATMLAHDVRFAARSLSRRPAFTTIVVVTLALCIGATTSVFSIVEAVLMRGLAYRDLDRLVAVWSNNPKEKNDRYQVSVGDYFDWRDRSRSFEQLAGFFPIWNATYTAADAAERLNVGAVSANFLSTLGVRPQIGRDFTRGEDQVGAAPVAILSHGFWTRSFQQDPSVIGKVVTLDGQAYVVAGVMGPEFTFPQSKVDVMVPLPILGSYITRRGVHMLSVIGRMRPGATVASVRAEMTPVVAQIEREHPNENAGLGVTVRPLRDDLLGDVRRPILVLFAAVCAVLLVGCANVANLMLSRALGRRQELAVRAAMGAEPGAIARQMLVESGMIALVAGVIGVALAFGATRALSSLLPASIAKIGTVRVDGTVLAFTLMICVGAALLCGIIPAMRGARGANRDALADAARGASRGRATRRLNNTFVVAELALALVLVVTAGLLINSFSRLVGIDAGFRAEQLVRMKVALPDQAYPRGPRRERFFENLLQQAAAIPGVQSVALVSRFPLHDSNITSAAMIEGSSYAATDQPPSVDYRVASPRYFATMGIPIVAGREFDGSESSDSGSTLVTVLNRVAANSLFGTTNVVGKRLRLGGAQSPLLTVIGVVGDIRDGSLREQPRAQAYVSSKQAIPCCGSIVVRYSNVASGTIVSGVRRIVASLDKSLPVYDVQTIDDVMSKASLGDRFTMTLLSGFAFIALVLAALGTYGVIAYGVAERTREIGVRMALGARAGEVRGMILREGMTLFACAVPFAVLGVWWANRALTGLLFETAATDPVTLATAAGTLGLATALACYFPARRASRVDPTIAIRS